MSESLPPIDLSKLPEKFQAAVDAIRKQIPKELQQPKWGIIW